MKNADKYHFGDFTLSNYRTYIRLAKKKYFFRNYVNFKKDENFVLWRHDVDYSVHAAVKLAGIESDEAVQSTFFLHLHNEFYNLFENEIIQLVNEILNLGHEIGLHFDIQFGGTDWAKHLKFEKEILEKLFDVRINAFSLHNPGISKPIIDAETYEGMVNCYSAYFRNGVPYCSDSFGIWRFERLEDVLTKSDYPRLQVLTHPEWWSPNVTSPKERVLRCINGRAESNKRRYETIMKNYGLEVIDW